MPKVEVNGIQFYYELHGPEGAAVLVLNNGIIMNAATSWAFYRVLQYDCRGQGQTDHPEEAYSMMQHADDLSALLDALGIQKAHIAGISYGGEVAQAFALTYPEKTLSLIHPTQIQSVGLS
jgi:pimeloyl-ACP methyl ester carboxylesterase